MADQPTAAQQFQGWLATEVAPFLGERGWRRKAGVFRLPVPPNTGLIEFRRYDAGSNRTTHKFFIEVGVFSPALATSDAAFHDSPLPRAPTLLTGAVGGRLSDLMGERGDRIFAIRASDLSVERAGLGENVREKLAQFALPWIEAHLTDRQIRDDLLVRVDELGPIRLRWLDALQPGDDS